jgi:hypothetical protein
MPLRPSLYEWLDPGLDLRPLYPSLELRTCNRGRDHGCCSDATMEDLQRGLQTFSSNPRVRFSLARGGLNIPQQSDAPPRQGFGGKADPAPLHEAAGVLHSKLELGEN